MSIDFTFGGTLKIPMCVAPMFMVSCPAMTLAACAQGVMSGFPAHSTQTREEFSKWLDEMAAGLSEIAQPAPWAVNLVVHDTNERLEGDLALCIERKIPIILTSKGAPRDVFARIHDYGGLVFHDVASARHAEKAAQAGADALIAIAAGAGGKTGTVSPFALLNEIREVTDKPIILAGGMSTGRDVFAAEAMGASLAYVGTRFIATKESLADTYTSDIMVASSAKDILFTTALSGAPQNWVRPTLVDEGINPDEILAMKPGTRVKRTASKARQSKVKSAGHGIGMIKAVEAVTDLCERIKQEYRIAKEEMVAYNAAYS